MNLLSILIATLGFSMILAFMRFLQAHNSYEKIISFYLIFTQFILMFLAIATLNSNKIFDIIIIFLLLKLVAILFLLFNRKKL